MNIIAYLNPVMNENQETVGTYLQEAEKKAVEVALRAKEALNGEVTALTVGQEPADEILREAFAMGADNATMVAGVEENADNIAAALKKTGYDVVVASSDLAEAVAAKLGIAYVVYNGEDVKDISSKFPCVISTADADVKHRYMHMRGVYSAYNKTVKQEQL